MDHTGLAAELKSKNTCMCELQELLLQSPRSERKALKQKVEVLEADVEVLADELSTANKLQAKIAELQFLEEQLLQSPRSMQMNKQATNYSFEIKELSCLLASSKWMRAPTDEKTEAVPIVEADIRRLERNVTRAKQSHRARQSAGTAAALHRAKTTLSFFITIWQSRGWIEPVWIEAK